MNQTEISPNSLTARSQLSLVDSEKFIYTLVHELRNPLTNIHLALSVLENISIPPELKTYLDMIARNLEKMDDIVSQFLNAGTNVPEGPEKHSFHYLLDEILLLNDDRLKLRSVKVRKSFCNHDFKIAMPRSKMKIALANIIINAIEAVPEGNGVLEITTRLLNGVYHIVIRDNGSGISKENLQNIFKPHFTTKSTGMGLGLSGSLAILNSNDIKVNVRSDPRNGTRFLLSCAAC